MIPTEEQKSLLISIIGEPNSGKSTLLNRIIGQKISIVTHKVQTTRENIRAIYTNEVDGIQLIFTDTPGLFNAKGKLEHHIVSNALKSIGENNLILLLIDAKRGISNYIKQLLESNSDLKHAKNIIAVINKIDAVSKERQFELVDELSKFGIFKEYFAISALKGKMVEKLVQHLESCSYKMPWIYNADLPTDTNVRTLAEEITREKIFLNLHKELPYSIKVETDSWQEEDDKVVIHQSVFAISNSHKKIILGKGGSKIKMLGQQARYEISDMLEKNVSLYLHVKIREDWIDRDY